ncbi:MAG: hypothetical protein OXT71_18510 [Acidobacteriota bacterium]|nr:hypothetical protein [Acidobacteriota bacterium]
MQTDAVQRRVSTPEEPSRTSPDPTDEARLRTARWAFRRFHGQCFWYLRVDLEITRADLPMIVDGLRKNGGHAGFLLAAKLCR